EFPLAPTPMREVTITTDAITVEELKENHPDIDRALFKVMVQYRAGADSRDTIDRAVRAAFGKRLVGIDWREAGKEADASVTSITPTSDFRTTVRQYLESKLPNDPQRQALLDLADQFMTTGAEGQQ